MSKLSSIFHSQKESYELNYLKIISDMSDKIDMLSRRLNILEDHVYGVIDATQHQQQLNNTGVKFMSQHPIIIENAEIKDK